ncbi:phosphoadenosine phosphosulfate reductase [Rhodovulum sp. 12E13]|uniref:phosphoadenosine phosphosulfate reductase n=1 Tax=Rhodovulum sp. 12E13 TaxID=2203891 RepID=UPI000E158AFF|nr:phosphoadenosine phosphosulfate reductase [Rhodovulum sp. 12E13]RDC71678.1 phosphoadenosine phosphosulfate reductase [Rhodovulum sp. 12E13]
MTTTTAAWLSRLDQHAMEHGFHARLAERHGALYTEEDQEVLLVTFENAEDIRAQEGEKLPAGLRLAGREGWSQLCLYSEGTTWFRDAEVYAFFDDLVDDGFFDLFDRVLFYGAGAEGYAACAFSVAAPGAAVLAIRPQATLDPARAVWDHRFMGARRLDFTGRYGYAPAMVEAAERVSLIYDPTVSEDAMHAALFGPRAQHFRTAHLGWQTDQALAEMGVTWPLVRAAALGRLDRRSFARIWRKRHRHRPYLRSVLRVLAAQDRPFLSGLWARRVLQEIDRPAFHRALAEAEETLERDNRALPPPLWHRQPRESGTG